MLDGVLIVSDRWVGFSIGFILFDFILIVFVLLGVVFIYLGLGVIGGVVNLYFGEI